MFKRELTEFGKEVKLELMLRSQTQEWLIQQVKERTGMYVDSSVLYKVMTGQVNSAAIQGQIKEILNIA